MFGSGICGELEDFKTLRLTRGGRGKTRRLSRLDKGQTGLVAASVNAFRGAAPAPIPFEELVATMRVVFAARESLHRGHAVDLREPTSLTEDSHDDGRSEAS